MIKQILNCAAPFYYHFSKISKCVFVEFPVSCRNRLGESLPGWNFNGTGFVFCLFQSRVSKTNGIIPFSFLSLALHQTISARFSAIASSSSSSFGRPIKGPASDKGRGALLPRARVAAYAEQGQSRRERETLFTILKMPFIVVHCVVEFCAVWPVSRQSRLPEETANKQRNAEETSQRPL